MEQVITRNEFEDVLFSNTLTVVQKDAEVPHMVHLTNLYVIENNEAVAVYKRVISSCGSTAKTEFFFENLKG